MGSISPLRLVPRSPEQPVLPLRSLPTATIDAALPRRLPATGGSRGEYALGDIARELKLSHRPIRAIIDALRVLASHDGLPLPRTPRIERGQLVRGAKSICRQSRWDAGEIDAWLDGRGPAGPAAALPAPIRDELRRRAEGIAA